MRITRRQFTAAAFAGLAGLAAPGALAQRGAQRGGARRETLFDWKKAAEGVHVALGRGGNAMVIAGAASATLIDTKNTGFGGQLRREAEKLGGRPITRVINTHHHMDHSGGNHVFTAGGVVLAHANAKPRIEQQVAGYRQRLRSALRELPRALTPPVVATRDDVTAWLEDAAGWAGGDFAPTETMAGASHEIDVDGVKVLLRHVGAGHTDNDVFVWLPEKNVLHTGDLLFHGLNPYIDTGAGATTRGWDVSIDAMAALCDADTLVVPGHGELTDRAGLRGQSAYFETLRGAVRAARAEGKTREEVVALTPEGVVELGFERMLSRNLGIVYDELSAE